jgi:hypothetical protein
LIVFESRPDALVQVFFMIIHYGYCPDVFSCLVLMCIKKLVLTLDAIL